ncbi:MAG: PAS domain S-box protein [Acidimicrobiia bacterium]|nr:PAS domain S-box protein [Acidimicrobiia bacterium]
MRARISLLSLAFALLAVPAFCQRQQADVLILNSYCAGFPWTDNQIVGIRSVLERLPYPVTVWIEFMDAARFGDELARLPDYYRRRYSGKPIQLIFSTDDDALQFLLRNHDSLFPAIPVVFSGVNQPGVLATADRSVFTGVAEAFSTTALLDLALSFHPATRHLLVVTENSPAGAAVARDLAVVRQRRALTFEHLDGARQSLPEIERRLREAPDQALVFLSGFHRDNRGRYYSGETVHRRLAQASRAPVYSPSISELGQGIIAGSAEEGFRHGRLAGEIGARILDGVSPAAIPLTLDDKNTFVFDYEQLQRWGIDEALVPQGSIVVNRPDSVYYRYKWQILGLLAFLLLQAFVITGLVLSSRRRRKAERELSENRQFLSSIMQNSPAVIYVKDLEGRYLMADKQFERIQKEVIGKTDHEILPKEWADIYRANDLRVLETRREMEFEEAVPLDDSIHTFLSLKFPLFDSAGDPYAICGVSTDITERKRVEMGIRHLAEGVSARKGESFFREIVQHLGQALGADFAFVGKTNPPALDSVQTSAVYADGQFADNFEYQLAGTPCASVVGSDLCLFPSGIVRQFPEDLLLRDMAVDGYAGCPLRDSSGSVAGLIVVLFRRPIPNPDLVGSVLQVFAIRAAAEMERLNAEKELLASRESLRALAARLETIREKERARISREIHDQLGQYLTAIRMELSFIPKKLREQATPHLQEMDKLIVETIDSIRRIATELRPALLDHHGLAAAAEWQVGEFQRRTGIQCHLRLEEISPPEPLTVAAFRILQEALTNVARHARADQVWISIGTVDGDLCLQVEDNGVGLPADAAAGAGSLGLLGMRERARMAGGEVSFEPGRAGGTLVEARFPFTVPLSSSGSAHS